MFRWSDESIHWYQTASDWTNYHEILGREIAEFFTAEDEVCDIGCGLGMISVILSEFVKHIISVDVEPRVIKILSDSVKERGIQNITPLNADWTLLQENCCDTALTCSFGTLSHDFYRFMRLARKRLVVVKRARIDDEKGFTTEHCRQYGANSDEEFLEKNNIPYFLKSFRADFGQPLREWEEAVRFIEHYRLKPGDQSMDDDLKLHMIRETGGEYRYYLPNIKNIHIVVIEKEDVKA